MFLQEHRKWKLMVAILTLSLLTVMAGAAVAPALGVIQEYFSGESKMMVQLIISMPAVFIAVTNLFFEKLCRICRAKTLTLIGLGMYIIFGCGAGLFSNIYLVLVCRALVGVGVGIIMPMSTGLITYYFTRDKQDVLMGYSSAMNMLGGVVATLIAGALAMINWRMSFLVYLLGVISIVPVALWMPNERIIEAGQQKKSAGIFRNYYPFIVGMFFLMVIFFNYPALSVALYIAQFTTPAIVTVCEKILGSVIANVTSYHVAIFLSLLFTLWCVLVVDRKPAK